MKQQIEDYATKLVVDVEDGNKAALPAYGEIDYFIKLFTDAKRQIQGQAIDELGDQKERIEGGYQFKITSAKRQWKFDSVQEWNEKHKAVKDLENELKKRYEFVASSDPGSLPVGEDGEVLDLPRVEYTKEGLSVKPVR